MATWPSKFKVSRDNFTEKLPNRVIRSNMDVGPAKTRRRTVLGVKELTGGFHCSPDDDEDFEEFYLANDALWFDFPHPRTGQTVKARFTDVPQANMNETIYEVIFSLEILP